MAHPSSRSSHFSSLITGACLLALTSLQAEQTATHPYGFAPAEIFLSDFNSREMRTGDFNQDGRTDLLVLNPEKARLDFYFQNDPETGKAETPQLHQNRWQPVLSHPRFTKESLIPGAQLQALEVGDFNQDGHIDFATINAQDHLEIYHGPLADSQKPGFQIPVNGHHGYIDCLKWHAADQSLYYLGPELLERFHWDPENQNYQKHKVAQLPQGEDPYRLQFMDLNRDGESDIIYELNDVDYGLAIHLREKDHWLPMQRPVLEPASSSFIPGPAAGSLYAIHNDSGAIQSFEFEQIPEKESNRPVSIEEIHLPSLRQGQFIPLVENNDLNSLLIFSPGQTEIHQLAVDENGRLGFPQSRVVPSGCQWILKGSFLAETKAPQVLIHNPKNRYLGLMPFAGGNVQFPIPIPNTAAFICAQIWRPETADQDQLIGIVREESRKLFFKRWRILSGEEGLALEELQQLELDDVKRDPEAFIPLPTEKGRPDGFLVTSPLGESFYLFAKETGAEDLEPVHPPKGFSSEQLKKKRAGNFRTYPAIKNLPSSLAYIEGDEIEFYAVDAQGVLRLVQQINSDKMNAIQDLLPLDNAGRQVALVSEGGREVEIHAFEKTQGYQFQKALNFPPGAFHTSQLIPSSRGPWELLALGNQQLRRIFNRPDREKLASQTLFQSDLPEYWPDEIFQGDMNGDGQANLLLLEKTQFHMFEILAQEGQEWKSMIHFPVFETAPGSQRKSGGESEPRETMIADINGDGLDDIVMLVHDRLLLYLQDAIPPGAPAE
ncbi:VCBS repeat-containing protein [Kiritimatiellaeota bacterium B1221]|nr:VCBS repeat-containing protein [Kiritimatiellaeota bacterium B1221]